MRGGVCAFAGMEGAEGWGRAAERRCGQRERRHDRCGGRFRSRPCGARRKNSSASRQTRVFSRPLGMSEECRETEEKVCRRSVSRCNDGRKKPGISRPAPYVSGRRGDGGAGLQNIKSETRLAEQFDSARLSKRLRRLLSSAY